MITVEFVKHFVNGPMQGLDVPDRLRCPTFTSAAKWAREMVGREVEPCAGASHYVVRDVYLREER